MGINKLIFPLILNLEEIFNQQEVYLLKEFNSMKKHGRIKNLSFNKNYSSLD